MVERHPYVTFRAMILAARGRVNDSALRGSLRRTQETRVHHLVARCIDPRSLRVDRTVVVDRKVRILR